MSVTLRMDVYEPKEIRDLLKKALADTVVEIVEEDRRADGGDYVIFTPEGEYWIERKTVSDLFISLARNVYEHGKPKVEGRERKLFTQLLKLKGEGRIPVLLIEGAFPEDAVKRHTLIGVEEWCVRNGVFVIHTIDWDDTVYAVARLVQKQIGY